MTELTEAAIAELKARHGQELSTVTAPDGSVWVLRPPTKASWNAFQTEVIRDRDRPSALYRFTVENVVHPDRAAVVATADRYPAFPNSVANVLSDMAGASAELDVKKL